MSEEQKIVPPPGLDIGDWRDPDKMIERMLAEAEAHPGHIVKATHGAWSVCFSTKNLGGKLGNVFSLKLRQRGSKERDWMILGRMAARIGAPTSAMPDTVRTDPEATHYWVWGGEATKGEAKGWIAKAQQIFHRAVGN